ncbi:MAG: ATP-binding protein [Clostridia bacterium]
MEKKPESVILILRDITRQQKLEDMRKEFVANVSHELKTPLTSIKSYSETLLSGMVEDQDTLIKFLRVIDSEAERMSNLVRDLLQLSSIDMDQLKLNKNRHVVMDLIQKTIEKVSFEADKKRQRITTDIRFEGKAPMDHDRIQQVLINLLGNAIKYTDEEGTIHVACWQQDDELRISVEDNGVGIPEKDLPRVFDRFYRVDKGRSRKMGGTGLGLAIAREIMLAHMGDISIESRLDEGTRVTLTLPLKYIGGSG